MYQLSPEKPEDIHDLTEAAFNVDLKTLKERSKKQREKNKMVQREKPGFDNYWVAYRAVNNLWKTQSILSYPSPTCSPLMLWCMMQPEPEGCVTSTLPFTTKSVQNDGTSVGNTSDDQTRQSRYPWEYPSHMPGIGWWECAEFYNPQAQ